MKILMTLMGLEIGGAETHVVELAKELHKQGHHIVVASNGGVYEQALAAVGIAHVQIPMHQRNASKMLRSLRLLRALIQKEQPDLVHAHARIPAFLCGILQKQMGFPFITSAHWVFEVTPLLQVISNWGQRTVAVSEDIKSYLMMNYRVPADQIHVTINGIDTEQFAPGNRNESLARELGIGSGPVIGNVSRLDKSREEAARELIGLMPQLLKTHPTAQLLIVGGGNQEAVLRQQAEQINKKAGRNAIIMTGPRTDIAQLVGLCDIFVGVSRAALEAMAAEKPTILAGNEGYIGTFTREALPSSQQTNFCCRGFDPIRRQQLLQDLEQILQMDEDALRQLGQFGREVVLEHYSVAKMTQDYLEAYERLLHPAKPVRATISGYYGYGNLGDDSILLAISQRLAKSDPPIELTVLSRRPRLTTGQYGLRAVHRFSPISVLKTLKRSHILISGGGSLLQDKTSTRSLLYYLSVIREAKLLHKPVFLYANGIGPLRKESNRRRVRNCLNTCDIITLRDRDSLSELQQLGVNRQDIIITSDPALALHPQQSQGSTLSSFGIPENGQYIGISVRSLPEAEHFSQEFAKLCDRLSAELGKTIVFLVMQECSDTPISRAIADKMTEPSYIVKTPGDPGAMLAIIEKMDVLISMRLHTIIFAASVHVPIVGCVYDPKVASILDMLNMPSCGTPDTIDAGEAFQITRQMLQNLEQHRQVLTQCVTGLTPLAEQTALLLEQMIREQIPVEELS